jgi:hypothetical protein
MKIVNLFVLFFICFLQSCTKETDIEFRVFFPTEVEESYFKNRNIAKIPEIDIDMYHFQKNDTTITYSYQQGNLLSVSWEFPFQSKSELLLFFFYRSQMLLTPLEGCKRIHYQNNKYSDTDELSGYFFLKNGPTNHIFTGGISDNPLQVRISYQFLQTIK